MSTKSPGEMNPATPRTSSTGTVTARIPVSMTVDMDACSFGAVTFDATIGSSRTNGERTSRRPSLTRSSTCENPPCGLEFAGQGTSFTFSAVIGAPYAMASLATTIVPVAAVGSGGGAEWLLQPVVREIGRDSAHDEGEQKNDETGGPAHDVF